MTIRSAARLSILLSFLALSVAATPGAADQKPVNWKRVRVLVYTKNGQGYVHDNIPAAVQSIQQLAGQFGFKVDVSDQPSVFTEKNISQYTLLILPSTNNDVFETNEQRLVLRRYLEAGGGLVGIHSVLGTERNWSWFKMMLGGTFAWHPRFQRYRVNVIDPTHPSIEGLPPVWERSDECYFMKELYPGIHVLLAHDLKTLSNEDHEKIVASAAPFARFYPAAWYQNFDGGHIWITALGHDKKDYSDAVFVQHVRQGLTFIAASFRGLDYKRAYASSWDEPVRY